MLDLIEFGLFIVLLIVGFFAGTIVERRHYASIRKREREYANVLAFSVRFPPDRVTPQRAFLVHGTVVISSDYFKTFGIRVTRGRAFTEQDRAGSVPVAIVNDVFVSRYLKGVDPLTQRLLVEQLIPGVTKLGPAIEWQIVGVYAKVRNAGPKDDGFPEIDVPFWQSPWPGTVMAARSAGAASGMQQGIAAAISASDATCRWPT